MCSHTQMLQHIMIMDYDIFNYHHMCWTGHCCIVSHCWLELVTTLMKLVCFIFPMTVLSMLLTNTTSGYAMRSIYAVPNMLL